MECIERKKARQELNESGYVDPARPEAEGEGKGAPLHPHLYRRHRRLCASRRGALRLRPHQASNEAKGRLPASVRRAP